MDAKKDSKTESLEELYRAAEVIIATDCGSTTTKALLFEKTSSGWRQTFRGEAPTTVERPVADVTVGVRNAFREVQELSGRRIILENDLLSGDPDSIPIVLRTATLPADGVDLYISTSSAGGGLQMVVSGVSRQMSAESAERAALGGGAIVLDVISADDGRADFEKVERLRHLRPDIFLLCGGVDGGSKTHPVEFAELLLAAQPKPRFGSTLRLPVIYAANPDAFEEVKALLDPIADLTAVPNVRPQLEREDLVPARTAVHEIFLSHVMSHSPGYDKLLNWTPVPILPTPSAVALMVEGYAREKDIQMLCVDIGGATTDVFSVFNDSNQQPVFNRTVSANLGMSYSVANVLVEAGVEAIGRWLPYQLSGYELRDRLRNKMIRPTSIPQTKDDLWLEQAVCREALRLSLKHHTQLAVGLSGVQKRRGISEIFQQSSNRHNLVNLTTLDLALGSGGVLSHAPERISAALMLLEGFALEGVTELAVDSIFMLPHLGVLHTVNPLAAREIFENDCLIRLGFAIVPVSSKRYPAGTPLAQVSFSSVGPNSANHELRAGDFSVDLSCANSAGTLTATPLRSEIDLGCGAGQVWQREVTIGECGLILDGRGRPFSFFSDQAEQINERSRVMAACNLL